MLIVVVIIQELLEDSEGISCKINPLKKKETIGYYTNINDTNKCVNDYRGGIVGRD